MVCQYLWYLCRILATALCRFCRACRDRCCRRDAQARAFLEQRQSADEALAHRLADEEERNALEEAIRQSLAVRNLSAPLAVAQGRVGDDYDAAFALWLQEFAEDDAGAGSARDDAFSLGQPASISCPVCMEPGPSFHVTPCNHATCVRCAVRYVRTAISNARESVKPEGIRCITPGCTSFITPDAVRRLAIVSRELAPATSSFTGPVTPVEVNRLDGFVVEATLSFNQKMYCPRCERVIVIDDAQATDVECPYCHNRWNCAAHSGQDTETTTVVSATSKACPNCGMRITHYHGHDCHHISPGTGCPGCGQHFCYVCLRKHGVPGRKQWNTACEHQQSFCNAGRIREHLVLHPYPHDGRCGCPICPDCRRGAPCSQCPGTCVVCTGSLPPGGRRQWAPSRSRS